MSEPALLILALILVLTVGLWVGRLILKQFSEERKQMVASLLTMGADRQEEHAAFVRCVDANTKSTDTNTEVLRLVQDHLRK